MLAKLLLCLALVLSGLLTGCVTQREFRGSTANLKSNGDLTSNTNFLKMSVAGSGVTTNGGNYLVLSLPEENCQLALFYPKLKPYPYYYFKAEVGTNQIHAWQIDLSNQTTNHITVHIDLPPNQTDAWVKRGKTFSRSELAAGVTGSLPASAERLHGQIEMEKKGGEFHINVDLSNENGVKLSGIFDSYRTLWRPLLYPYILIFGPFVAW